MIEITAALRNTIIIILLQSGLLDCRLAAIVATLTWQLKLTFLYVTKQRHDRNARPTRFPIS